MNKLTNVMIIAIIFLIIGTVKSSPVNTKVVFVRDNSLWVYEIGSKKTQEFLKNGDNPACSFDGKTIAFTRNYNVWIFSTVDKKEVQLTNFDSKTSMGIRNLSWSPKQDYIVFERDEQFTIKSKGSNIPVVWPEGEYQKQESQIDLSCIWIVNVQKALKTGPRKLIGYSGYGNSISGTLLSSVGSPSWSPDGKEIAFIRNGDIWLATFNNLPPYHEDLDPEDKVERRIASVADLYVENNASPSTTGATYVSWSPDGKRLVLSIERIGGSGVGELWILDINTNRSYKILSTHDTKEHPIFLDKDSLLYDDWWNLRLIDIDGENDHVFIESGKFACSCSSH
jgi:Tol biopolymer transport system component